MMPPVEALYPSFADGLRGESRARFEVDAERVKAALETHWQAARQAWPDIIVAPEHFAQELGKRLGLDATIDSLARTRSSDVYLAIACADGDPEALSRFERRYLREVDHAGTKLRATPDQIAEVKAQLREVLLVDGPGRPAATREFSGRGELRAYVRVMATRDLIRAINRGRRETPITDDEILDRLASQDDPEISILRAQYRGTVDQALRAALAGLDDRSRALLRYQVVDGWSIDQVGRVYGVHRATAARWLAVARATLGDGIRAELAARLEIDADEVASLIRLVQSRIDVSLDRLLATAQAEWIGDPAPRAQP